MSFLTGSKIAKFNISKQLSQILILSCVNCRNRFDQSTKRPNLLLNCQHYICDECVKEQLQSKDPKCDDCQSSFKSTDIIADRYLERINQLKVEAAKLTEICLVETIMARKLSEDFQGWFFCVRCNDKFDLGRKKPFAICNQMHVLCKQCLESEQ